jgi:MoaA/NifB/PqqE/SkfB family radical SAM enzyme
MLDWFKTEVRALPVTFAKANQNITNYTVAGIFKMLAVVNYEHLPELRKLATSSDASLLHEIPSDIGKIAKETCAEVLD